MNTKLKSLLRQLLRSPLHFPVEAALGLAFFIIAVVTTWNGPAWIESPYDRDIFWLFVPLVTLSFWLQRVNRWLYLASFFLFLPLMALNLKPFLWTYGFWFIYVLAGILLIVGNKRMDNRPFVAHALHVVTQLFFGLLITAILFMAVMAIVASFLYIFGIDWPRHLFEHIAQFIWFVMAPQICCTLIRQDEDEVGEPAKVLKIIINYILSPAVIIYTIILYTYFVKIVFEWDLPKGGVAWMVMAFFAVALAGSMAQSVLSERHYDWFYRHFTLIAIPPLLLFWVGALYRIRLYGFTESRFYLMVAGVLMTFFMLLLFKERTRRYQLMTLLFGAAIILFTYIPGISSKSIGLHCQRQRLAQLVSDLQLTDATTGKLNNDVDVRAINQNPQICEKYKEACSVISYVRKGMGAEAFERQYGEWTHSEYNFNFTTDPMQSNGAWHERQKPMALGDYSLIMPKEQFQCVFDGETVTIEREEGAVVLRYPIAAIVSQDTMLLHHPEQLFSYRNDSMMLVLDKIWINESGVKDIETYLFHLFRKQTK